MAITDNIKLLVGIFLLGACVYFTHRYDAGQEAERNLANARAYASAIVAANDARLAAEQRHAAETAANTAASEQRLRGHDNALNTTITALRAGNLRLRLATDGTPGAGAVSSPSTNPGQSSGADGADALERLAIDVAQRLAIGDKAVIERNQCVDELKIDRRDN